MMCNKDGGPAFPVQSEIDPNGQVVFYPERGMTLRDYFAGQALAGWCAKSEVKSPDELIADGAVDLFAEQCYKMADAMLAARAASDA